MKNYIKIIFFPGKKVAKKKIPEEPSHKDAVLQRQPKILQKTPLFFRLPEGIVKMEAEWSMN